MAYQSCDDSLARTGLYDEAKCASNARAYGENPDVIGVVGTYNSACAVAVIPELNRAPSGPLAMVSPLNDFVGLTRQGPGVDPSLPAALYPTGVRSYARVYPTDDLGGAALALLARDRGRTRVFVLDDGEPGYGALQATTFETAARRVGLDVVGRATWDPRADEFTQLARRVADVGSYCRLRRRLDRHERGTRASRPAWSALGRRRLPRACRTGSCPDPHEEVQRRSARHVPEPLGPLAGVAAAGGSSVDDALRDDAGRGRHRPCGGLRGASDGGTARRDRALGRNATLGARGAVPYARRSTACWAASGSTPTGTSPRAR